ncbi:MAG: response regulator [Arenimonas sp.]|nr:response regulator [Arenimonas sp.]MBP6625802.1 response regulator [Arenimonas sp.]
MTNGKRPSGVTVYIVDDDESVRLGFARLIRSAGYDARVFDSPECFLDDVVDAPFTCILLDISMPRLTGTLVQERLNARNIAIPVITVSATDDERTREHARTLGARLFLRKPVDDQALLDAISWVTNSPFGS